MLVASLDSRLVRPVRTPFHSLSDEPGHHFEYLLLCKLACQSPGHVADGRLSGFSGK